MSNFYKNFSELNKNDLIKKLKINKNLVFEEEQFFIHDMTFSENNNTYVTLKHKQLGYFCKTILPSSLNTCIDIEEMSMFTTLDTFNERDITAFLQELKSFYLREYERLLIESQNAFKKVKSIDSLKISDIFKG